MMEDGTAHRLKRGSRATSHNSRSVLRPSPLPLHLRHLRHLRHLIMRHLRHLERVNSIDTWCA